MSSKAAKQAEDSTSASVHAAAKAYEDGAKALLAANPALVVAAPPEANSEGQRVIDALRKLAAAGPSPFLLDPAHAGAPWADILSLLLDRSITVSSGANARVLVVQGQTGKTALAAAVEIAITVYHLLRDSVVGIDPTPEELAVAHNLFGDEPMPASKDKWETELKNLKAKLADPDQSFPETARALAPAVAHALALVEAAPALSARRPPADRWEWTAIVGPPALALHRAVNQLLRWAAGRAFVVGDPAATAANAAALAALKTAAFGRRASDKPDKPDPPVPPPPGEGKDQPEDQTAGAQSSADPKNALPPPGAQKSPEPKPPPAKRSK